MRTLVALPKAWFSVEGIPGLTEDVTGASVQTITCSIHTLPARAVLVLLCVSP